MNILNILRGIKKIQASLTSLKLATFTLQSGDTVETDGEAISQGSQVFLKSESGDYSLLPDGAYETKDNIQFSIKEGIVDSVKNAPAAETKTESEEPIQQAQSKVENEETKTETPVEVKAEEITAPAAVTVDVSALIQSALEPVYQQIYSLQEVVAGLTSLLQLSSDKTKEVETNLSKVTDTVKKIAETPAAQPAEGAVHAFAKPTNKDPKLDKAYKLMYGDN